MYISGCQFWEFEVQTGINSRSLLHILPLGTSNSKNVGAKIETTITVKDLFNPIETKYFWGDCSILLEFFQFLDAYFSTSLFNCICSRKCCRSNLNFFAPSYDLKNVS